jgi:hypothetical protein
MSRDLAKGGSLGEERNDAGAAFGCNPKGQDALPAVLCIQTSGVPRRPLSRYTLVAPLPFRSSVRAGSNS